MEDHPRIIAAKALDRELLEFEKLSGQHLVRVSYFYFGETVLEKVRLDFESASMELIAQEDDDTLLFSIASNHEEGAGLDVSGTAPWASLISHPFGWGWLTINQQDYIDGMMISFDGIIPTIVFNVVASAIHVCSVHLHAGEGPPVSAP